jgi:hypothetical protein
MPCNRIISGKIKCRPRGMTKCPTAPLHLVMAGQRFCITVPLSLEAWMSATQSCWNGSPPCFGSARGSALCRFFSFDFLVSGSFDSQGGIVEFAMRFSIQKKNSLGVLVMVSCIRQPYRPPSALKVANGWGHICVNHVRWLSESHPPHDTPVTFNTESGSPNENTVKVGSEEINQNSGASKCGLGEFIPKEASGTTYVPSKRGIVEFRSSGRLSPGLLSRRS